MHVVISEEGVIVCVCVCKIDVSIYACMCVYVCWYIESVKRAIAFFNMHVFVLLCWWLETDSQLL